MEGFTTIEMRFEVIPVNDGLLVRMVGKCVGECNEIALKLGEQKVDRSADICSARRRLNVKEVASDQFYREYIFGCQESVDRFYEMLTDEQ